jgi:hypothetical protein
MQILNFLVSTCCLFLLLFSLHLFFAKKGNKLLNVLLSIIFFGRFGQTLVSLIISSEQHNLLPYLHQIFTPFYYMAPACFYLYVTSFIHERNRLRKFEYLHFIPALLAIIHVIPWQIPTQLNWDLITKQLSENGYFFSSEKNGLFPAYFHSIIRPLLVLTYLIAAWIEVLCSKIVEEKTPDDVAKKWMFFFLKIATFFQLAGFLPVLLSWMHLPFQNSSFIVINCIVLLGVVLYALHKPDIFYGYLLVAVDWNKKPEEEKDEHEFEIKTVPIEFKQHLPENIEEQDSNIV